MSKKLIAIAMCLTLLLITTSAFAKKKVITPPSKTVDFTYFLSPSDAINFGVKEYTLHFNKTPTKTFYLSQPRGEFIDFIKIYDICKNTQKKLNMFTRHYNNYSLAETSVKCLKEISYSSANTNY